MGAVFVYSADVWCIECGEKIRAELDAKGERPESPDDEHTYDSDEYPKGPSEEGESDSPTHCAGCGAHLETELTRDGRRYVAQAVLEALEALPTWRRGGLELAEKALAESVALSVWCPYYFGETIDGPALRALWSDVRTARRFARMVWRAAAQEATFIYKTARRFEIPGAPMDPINRYHWAELNAKAGSARADLAAALYGTEGIRAALRKELGAKGAARACAHGARR
jgi:hypothetical protein